SHAPRSHAGEVPRTRRPVCSRSGAPHSSPCEGPLRAWLSLQRRASAPLRREIAQRVASTRRKFSHRSSMSRREDGLRRSISARLRRISFCACLISRRQSSILERYLTSCLLGDFVAAVFVVISSV